MAVDVLIKPKLSPRVQMVRPPLSERRRPSGLSLSPTAIRQQSQQLHQPQLTSTTILENGALQVKVPVLGQPRFPIRSSVATSLSFNSDLYQTSASPADEVHLPTPTPSCSAAASPQSITLTIDLSGTVTPPSSSSVVLPRPLRCTAAEFQEVQANGEHLGQGAYGKVMQVRFPRTGKSFAMKQLDLPTDYVTEHSALRELSQLFAEEHPHVVTAHEAFKDEFGHLNIFLELVDLGSLRSVLELLGRPFPSPIVATIMAQALDGLNFLHLQGIVHRDIKPSNLLLNSHGQVKIGDLGTSEQLLHPRALIGSVCGCERYWSPERTRNEPYGVKCDIWSMGIVAAYLALGVFPLLTEPDEARTSTKAHSVVSPSISQSSLSSVGSLPGPVTDAEHLNATPSNQASGTNPFSLAIVLTESRAKVDFDKVVQTLELDPKPSVDPLLQDFVWQCMEPLPALRPGCEALLDHPCFAHEVDFPSWLAENVLYLRL